MSKKISFDVCGGVCENCPRNAILNLAQSIVLVKRKVTKKYVPPELSALKILIEKDESQKDLKMMSDEELKRLEEELKKSFFKL